MLAPPIAREPRAIRIRRDVHVNVLLLAQRDRAAIDEICQRVGLSHAQYVALWTLCLGDETGDGLPIGSVSDGLLNRASDTTRLVDRLERDGFVERLPNPADRRSVLVRATRQGRDAFAEVTPELQRWHRDEWSNLTDDEVRTLHTLLAKALWADRREPHEPSSTGAP